MKRSDYVVLECTSTDLRRTKHGRLASTCWLGEDPEGGIELSSAPLLPAASQAFTAEELEARLAYYAERAEAGMPLFVKKGKPVPKAPGFTTKGRAVA